MAFTEAWNSIKEPLTYHNNTKCGPGSEIPLHNRVPGDGGKTLCKDCRKLNNIESVVEAFCGNTPEFKQTLLVQVYSIL